jgi:hypothetical protein
MTRPTLATFRAQFPSEVFGICQADPMVAAYANDSTERLLIDPKSADEGWYGTSVTLNLKAYVFNHAAYVVTPREIARLIVMSVSQQPLEIRNRFYEYLQFGNGLQPKHPGSRCGNDWTHAYERDNVITLAPLLPTPQKIRIYTTDVRDIGLRVLLQGKNQNDQVVLMTDPVTGQSASGEYVGINLPFTDSMEQYSVLTGIQKDETWGVLQFFQVDPVTGAQVELSAMEPSEGVAWYRRYLVSGLPGHLLHHVAQGRPLYITAQGKLDFVPVINETDYLLIPNVPALLEEAQSLRYSRMDSGNSEQKSAIHHSRALALLRGQANHYLGKINAAISFKPFGSADLRRLNLSLS